MNKRKYIILVLVFLSFFVMNVHASQIVDCGNEKIRCTSRGTLEYSRDGGLNWRQRFDTLFSTGKFLDLTMHNNELFAVTEKGVYASRDSGKNWSQRRQNSQYQHGDFQTISSDGKLLFATTSNGLYTSSDGGLNWTRRSY